MTTGWAGVSRFFPVNRKTRTTQSKQVGTENAHWSVRAQKKKTGSGKLLAAVLRHLTSTRLETTLFTFALVDSIKWAPTAKTLSMRTACPALQECRRFPWPLHPAGLLTLAYILSMSAFAFSIARGKKAAQASPPQIWIAGRTKRSAHRASGKPFDQNASGKALTIFRGGWRGSWFVLCFLLPLGQGQL